MNLSLKQVLITVYQCETNVSATVVLIFTSTFECTKRQQSDHTHNETRRQWQNDDMSHYENVNISFDVIRKNYSQSAKHLGRTTSFFFSSTNNLVPVLKWKNKNAGICHKNRERTCNYIMTRIWNTLTQTTYNNQLYANRSFCLSKPIKLLEEKEREKLIPNILEVMTKKPNQFQKSLRLKSYAIQIW